MTSVPQSEQLAKTPEVLFTETRRERFTNANHIIAIWKRIKIGKICNLAVINRQDQ